MKGIASYCSTFPARSVGRYSRLLEYFYSISASNRTKTGMMEKQARGVSCGGADQGKAGRKVSCGGPDCGEAGRKFLVEGQIVENQALKQKHAG